VSRDVETQLQAGLIALLNAATPVRASATVVPWNNVLGLEKYPAVAVQIDTGFQPAEDPGRGALYECGAGIGVITDLAYDRSAATCNRLIGKVRNAICHASALSDINAAMSGVVAGSMEIEGGEAGISETEQNIRTIRVRFFAVAT